MLHDEVVYYSPNSTRSVPVPVEKDANEYLFYRKDCDLFRFEQPQWWTNNYGWIAFVPVDSFKREGFFEPLQHDRAVAVYNDQHDFMGWGLAEGVAEKWVKMEDELFNLYFVLAKRLAWKPPIKPTPIHFLCPQKLHHTKSAAIHHISRCRKWVSMWIGLLSYTIAVTRNRRNNTTNRLEWVKYAADMGIAQTTLDKIQASVVCNTQCQRAGVFLDWLSTDVDQPSVEWFLEFKIPVWFPWTERHYISNLSKPVMFAPTYSPSVMASALQANSEPSKLPERAQEDQQDLQEESRERDSQTTVITVATQEPPRRPPYGHRGNRFLSDAQEAHLALIPWKSHFSKLAERNKEKEARETAIQRQARLDRAKKPSRKPGKGYSFFLWDWNDDNTALVRRQIQGKEVEDEMDRNPAECRFDPFSLTWEFCEYFPDENEDQAEVRKQAAEYAAEEDEFNNRHASHDEILAEHDEYDKSRSTSSPNPSTAQPLPSYLPRPVQYQPMDLLSTLRVFHGFVTPDEDEMHDEETRETMENVPQQSWILSMVVMHRDPSTPMLPDIASLVDSFIQGLVQDRMSAAFYDLAKTNVQCIDMDHLYKVFTRQGAKFMFKSCNFANFGDDVDVPWAVVLQDPIAATMVYRMLGYGANFRDICNVSTLVPTPDVTCSLKEVYAPRAIRLKDYVFTHADFIAYQEVCHSILSGPRGRAALMAGGIVARIAQDYLPLGGVKSGPSLCVTQQACGISSTDGEATYSDDALTVDELDCICGLYSVYTGCGAQETRKSWWPLHNLWINPHMGENFGYWTEGNERWYQNRLKEIEAGLAKPLTSSEWRKFLRRTPAVRAVLSTTRRITNEYFKEKSTS
ncbi:hypothetical protein CVT24_006210 [Panaeolus cyanescens]|uniref:Uncharacterized protein n=1 Tax=Panaeolus cyanescens TaxID=181874 RepID=A0A409YEI2_9AGAR|nr:hypothetical protein CVT24_006210 [Panaeolus cyanescens]